MPGATDGGLPELTSHLVLVKNQSSETAPAFAALEVTGFDAETGAYLVTKPTRANLTTVLFNGSQDIEAGDEGQASGNRHSVAGWEDDGSGEEPAAGDDWGTVGDGWFLVRRSTGFKVIDRPEGDDYNTVLVEPTDLTPVGTVEITSVDADGTGSEDLYYPAKLVEYNPAARTWSTRIDEVWYHSIDGVAPAVLDRIPATHEGWGSGRPVYGARLANPDASTGCTPEGWGWSEGLWPNECLLFEVLNKYGACSAIDATQWAYLRWDGASKWVSQRWNCLTLAWEDWDFTYDGGSGQVSFEIDATTGLPKLLIAGASRPAMLSCGGPGVVVFTIGGPDFCGGGGSSGETDCKNYVQLRVSCTCCPMNGFDGEGYYCISDPGEDCETATLTVVYLYETDKCRTDFQICSCRYATRAEADAACGTTSVVPTCSTPPIDFNAHAPSVSVSGQTGDCTCYTTAGFYIDGVDGAVLHIQPFACPGNPEYTLLCVDGVYELQTATGGVTTTCTAYTASPLSITFRITGLGANCGGAGGTIDVTITAAP